MIQEFEKKWHKKDYSQMAQDLRSGCTVRVHQKIKEGDKERVQMFEGLVIKVSSGYGVGKTFTVRKVVDGVGVEKIFPINSPNVQRIEIVKKSKVRRAKLYYMRDANSKKKLYEAKEKVKAAHHEVAAAEDKDVSK